MHLSVEGNNAGFTHSDNITLANSENVLVKLVILRNIKLTGRHAFNSNFIKYTCSAACYQKYGLRLSHVTVFRVHREWSEKE